MKLIAALLTIPATCALHIALGIPCLAKAQSTALTNARAGIPTAGGSDCPGGNQYDDGSSEAAFNYVLNAGEMAWLHGYSCPSAITTTAVQTAYGHVPNGNLSRIAVYDDVDCDLDPRTGLTKLAEVASIVVNANTDILNNVPIGPVTSGPCKWLLASAVCGLGDYPAAMDGTNPTPMAWVVGDSVSSGGSLDLNNLNNNSEPLAQMEAITFPTAWLLRCSRSRVVGGAVA